MGNAPSTGLEGTESQRRVVEAMETTDDRSSGFKELANPNSKSGDDGSSNPKPLHIHYSTGAWSRAQIPE